MTVAALTVFAAARAGYSRNLWCLMTVMMIVSFMVMPMMDLLRRWKRSFNPRIVNIFHITHAGSSLLAVSYQ